MRKILESAFKELGPVNGALYLVARTLERIGGDRLRLVRYYIVAQPIPDPPVPSCRPSATDTVQLTGPHDAQVANFPRPSHVIAQRFHNGNVCLTAVSKGQFAGFLWLAYQHYDEDEVRCHFVLAEPARSVWDFDVAVQPAFRMGRTFMRLWDHANEKLHQENIRWSFSRISAFNPQSLRSHGRLGTHTLHALTFLCLGRWQISWMNCPPYLHVGLSDRSAPTIRLHPPPVHRTESGTAG